MLVSFFYSTRIEWQNIEEKFSMTVQYLTEFWIPVKSRIFQLIRSPITNICQRCLCDGFCKFSWLFWGPQINVSSLGEIFYFKLHKKTFSTTLDQSLFIYSCLFDFKQIRWLVEANFFFINSVPLYWHWSFDMDCSNCTKAEFRLKMNGWAYCSSCPSVVVYQNCINASYIVWHILFPKFSSFKPNSRIQIF